MQIRVDDFLQDPEDELLYTAPGMGERRRIPWRFAPVDRPRFATGREGDGPRDYEVGGDSVPRWIGIEKPGSRSGYPADDPPPYAPGDAFGMGQASPPVLRAEPPGLVKTVLGGAEVVFKTQLSPPVTIRPFAPSDKPQVQGSNPISSAALRFAKPAFYLKTPAGLVPLFEPYGPPQNDYSGPVAFGLGLILAGGAWLGYKAVKKLIA